MKNTVLAWGVVVLLGGLVVMVFLLPAPVSEHSADTMAPTASEPTTPVSEEGVHIYSTAWGMTLAEDGSGFYNDLAALFLSGLDTPYNYDIRPYRRAKALFLRDNSSCLYPSNIELLQDGGEIASADSFIDTSGLLQVKVYIFSPQGTKPPASIADVSQKLVAYAMGSRIPFFLKEANADFIAVANESDKARGEIASADSFIDTSGLLQVKVYIFSPQGTKPPASIADVSQKLVAYAMGSRIPFFLKEANADFIAVANESDKARMLLTGRVDMMTAAMPDAQFVFNALGQPLPAFDPSYELNDTQVRITCHNTPTTRAFIDAFNERATTVLESGELQAFFVKNILDPKLYTPIRSP